MPRATLRREDRVDLEDHSVAALLGLEIVDHPPVDLERAARDALPRDHPQERPLSAALDPRPAPGLARSASSMPRTMPSMTISSRSRRSSGCGSGPSPTPSPTSSTPRLPRWATRGSSPSWMSCRRAPSTALDTRRGPWSAPVPTLGQAAVGSSGRRVIHWCARVVSYWLPIFQLEIQSAVIPCVRWNKTRAKPETRLSCCRSETRGDAHVRGSRGPEPGFRHPGQG
jgi:hypothetical protein